MALTANTNITRLGERLLGWTRGVRLTGRFAVVLAVAALASGVATYFAVSPGLGSPLLDERLIRVLLLTDLVLLLGLIAVVVRQVVRLWVERRRGSAGSKLHTRIVALFSIVAITPAIVMAVFSALFFQFGLQTWFSTRVTTAVRESVVVAESYIREHMKLIQADALSMAADLNRDSTRMIRNPVLFNQVVSLQARIRNLGEAIVFTEGGQIIARSGLSFAMEFERIPPDKIRQAEAGEVVLLQSEGDDRVRALVKLDGFLDSYLFVGRFVDQRVLDHVQRARQAAQQYEQLEKTRSGIEITFAALFIVVSLLVLLASVWFGLNIATRLVRPISGLIGAAERVRQGDFGARVVEGSSDDEMTMLGRAFNRMTAQLAGQRAELIEANRTLDERRRFTETVLAGVSAGVIGIGPDGLVTLPNPSALQLLDVAAEHLVGKPFATAVPEMAALFAEATARGDRQVQGNLTLLRGGTARNLAVRVSRETIGADTVGYVVTFDDITELVSAQRTAAWADVARRIAHEIKNPLTPIQLSAERLKRKYLKEVVSDREVFLKCTDTIIRQVGDIGRMVDEFSAFARMPAPTFKVENLGELAKQAIFLQQVANSEVDYLLDLPDGPTDVRCDSRQIAQALTNLLQNAADAIDGRQADSDRPLPRGRIALGIVGDEAGRIVLTVTDNGRGLPLQDRERLTEPYVTTRTKGTGLGLAIVKKIMEEHGGMLALADAPAFDADADPAARGASISLIFPAAQAAAEPFLSRKVG